MSARPAQLLLGFGAGAALALGLRIATSALDDSALYVTATAAALALSAGTWWAARARGRAAQAGTRTNGERGSVVAAFGAGAGAALLLLDALAPGAPPALPGAARAEALAAAGLPDAHARALASAWDGAGHAAAYAFESAAQDTRAFGILLREGVPAAPLVLEDAAELAAVCEHGLPSLAYARPHARVLVAGGAGGLDLACARHFSARSIDVLEPSAALRELAARVPVARPRDDAGTHVHWHAEGPRAFSRVHAQRYDLVVLPALLDPAHGWPAGVLPVREATLETEAGLAALLDTLVPAGALFASVNGEPAALRFVATARAALLRLGVAHPERHFAVHQSGDAYGVLVKRTQFVLDEVLDLHQQNRTRKPLAETPWFDVLLRGAEQPPVLRSTPGAAFLNRFGQLLASPQAASALAQHYLFDIAVPNDARPLFYETSRIDQPQSLSAHSAARVLPGLALIAIAVALVLAACAGHSLAPTVPARVRAASAPIAIGCAQALAYAWAQHAIALWLIPSHAFAFAALGGALGAWLGFGASRAAAFVHGRGSLLARALALAAFASVASALEPALARASAAGGTVLSAAAFVALLVLGAALALPSATALARATAASPTWLAFAHAAGLALALPLAATLVLFASYQALVIAAATLLALLVLAALRAPA